MGKGFIAKQMSWRIEDNVEYPLVADPLFTQPVDQPLSCTARSHADAA
jgi:hypothetical protein